MQNNWLVLTKHISIGDTEEQRIADLTCSASDSYPHGFLGGSEKVV